MGATSRCNSRLKISWSEESVVENVGGEEWAVEFRIDEILADDRPKNISAEKIGGGSDYRLPKEAV